MTIKTPNLQGPIQYTDAVLQVKGLPLYGVWDIDLTAPNH